MEPVQPMGEAPFPYRNQQSKKNKVKSPLFIGIVILAALAIGIFLMTRQSKKNVENKVTVIETPVPSPTETPKIDKATVKIQVLNGTGTPGQAGQAVKALEEAGYKAENIKTGNADKYDNLTTTISSRANYEAIVSNIEDALKPTFSDITVRSSTLDTSSEFDVVVVTGGKIFETIAPTKSVSSSSSSSSSTVSTPTPSPTLTPTPTP